MSAEEVRLASAVVVDLLLMNFREWEIHNQERYSLT